MHYESNATSAETLFIQFKDINHDSDPTHLVAMQAGEGGP